MGDFTPQRTIKFTLVHCRPIQETVSVFNELLLKSHAPILLKYDDQKHNNLGFFYINKFFENVYLPWFSCEVWQKKYHPMKTYAQKQKTKNVLFR